MCGFTPSSFIIDWSYKFHVEILSLLCDGGNQVKIILRQTCEHCIDGQIVALKGPGIRTERIILCEGTGTRTVAAPGTGLQA